MANVSGVTGVRFGPNLCRYMTNQFQVLLRTARMYLGLDKVFETDHVCFCSFFRSLLIGPEDETRG